MSTPSDDDPYSRIEDALGRGKGDVPPPPPGATPPPASGSVPPPPPYSPPPPYGQPAPYGQTSPQSPPPPYGQPAAPYSPPAPSGPPAGAADLGAPQGQPGGHDPFTTPPASSYPPATPYGYGPQPQWPVPVTKTDGMSVAAIICGVLSIFCMPFLGPVGLGLGIAGLRRTGTNGVQGRGMAITGIVTGALGTLFLLLLIVVIVDDPSAFA